MSFFGLAFDIAESVGVLVRQVQQSQAGPQENAPIPLLIIAPPPLAKLKEFEEMFKGGREKSQLLGKYYRKKALEMGCQFLDAAEFIQSSDLDGIHFEREEHRKLGEAVGEKIKEIFL